VDAGQVIAKSALIKADVLAVVTRPNTGRGDQLARPGIVARATQVIGEHDATPEA
jgi:hypothetical protein